MPVICVIGGISHLRREGKIASENAITNPIATLVSVSSILASRGGLLGSPLLAIQSRAKPVGSPPLAPVGEDRQRERDHEPDRDADQRQLDMDEQGRLVALPVVGDPVRAEAVALHAAGAAGGAIAQLELGEDHDCASLASVSTVSE